MRQVCLTCMNRCDVIFLLDAPFSDFEALRHKLVGPEGLLHLAARRINASLENGATEVSNIHEIKDVLTDLLSGAKIASLCVQVDSTKN